MPAAARTSDTTSHASPLNRGPGSTNVLIGKLAAWRALPSGVEAGLESASNAMSTLMSSPTLTPVDATATLAQVQAGLTQVASATQAAQQARAAEEAVQKALDELALVQAVASVGQQNRAAAASGKGLCKIREPSHATAGAVEPRSG